jgi:CoA:oxalate CoA-transferase
METKGPLAGIRVLELAQLVSGPYCTRLLAMLGADVYKVEPPAGDFARTFGPFRDGRSTFYEAVNTGKSGERLDLGSPSGRGRLEELIEESDVLVHNMTPSAAGRLGLTGPELAERHPGLVLCGLSAFGDAPDAVSRTGVDLVFQAESGLMAVTGEVDGQPLRAGTNVPDFYAAVLAALGVVAALYERQMTGSTRAVGVSLLDATVSMQTCWYAMLAEGDTPRRLGNESPFTMPTGTFRTGDGDLVLSIVGDRHWRMLCELLGLGEGIAERYATNVLRCSHRPEVRAAVEFGLADRPAREWLQICSNRGIPAGVVRTHAEVRANRPELFDDVGGIPIPACPIRFGAPTVHRSGHTLHNNNQRRSDD